MNKYIGISKPLNVVRGRNANLDAKYGPYDTINHAIIQLPEAIRKVGLTVGIITIKDEVETINEYWWKEGTSDDHLVKKVWEFKDLSEEEKDELKLYFEDLSPEEKFELKLKFEDLTPSDKLELKGAKGDTGDHLTVRKTYQTEAEALADKNPIDPTTSLPLTVGQFVSIVDDGEKNGIYRISSIGVDGTMSLELQGKLGDLSEYAKSGGSTKTLKEVDDEKANHGYASIDVAKTLKQVEDNASVKIKNEAVNGNFENGLIAPFGRSDSGGGESTLDINSSTPISGNYDIRLTIITPSTDSNRPIFGGLGRAANIGDKIYLHFYAKILSGAPILNGVYNGASATTIYRGDVINGRNTRIVDVEGTGNDLCAIYFDSRSVWDMQMDNFMRINLTETFGAGNEPTEEEFELLLSILGIDYFEGEIAIPAQKVMQWQQQTLKQVDDSVSQLAGDLNNKINGANNKINGAIEDIGVIESNVNSVVGGTIRTKYGVEDLGILNNDRYINKNTGKQSSFSMCIITNSIYLAAGDIITAYTGGNGIAVIAKSESQATVSTVFTPLVVSDNMSNPTTYKVEEAGHYAFSGRGQQHEDSALVIEVLKHSESEGSINEVKGSINEVKGSINEVKDLVEGKLEVTEYTLDDLQGEGAKVGYYLHNENLRASTSDDCIITKPLYLHKGDTVSCSTGGSGILLFARYTENYESISGTASSYSGVVVEDGWYVFSGRINRLDETNLVVNVKTYRKGESLQEQLDKKVNKSDIASLAGGSGYALSIGADMVKDAIPAEPWFDEVSNDGTTYGTYLDDKIDSVPVGDSFIFISDVHYTGNRKQSARLIDYVRRRLGIKTVIHGGDVLNEKSTIAAAAKEWLDFNRDFVLRIGGDFKQVCGDHDHNGRYADTGQAFSYQFVQRVMNGYNIKELTYDTIYDEQVKEIAVVNGWSDNDMKEYDAWKKMHYYFDDSTIKTRFVILHTGWTGDVGLAVEKLGSNVLSESYALYLQMDFLHQSLLSAPSNYNVVVIGHNAIGNKRYSTTVDGTTVNRYNVNEPVWKGTWQQIAKMLRAFKNKSSVGLKYRDWSGSGVQTKLFDFASANTPNIVFCMGGDVHWDIMCKSTENSETLEPISVATSLDKIIVTEGTILASDIPHILTMTDGGDRGYRGIITPIDSSYNDTTDSVQISASNTAGTLNSQAFDIITITDSRIYMTRIGSANDRVIYIE